MHDPETFELRLGAALRRYTADDPRTVDAGALARSIATAGRSSQPVGLRARLGLGAMPRRLGMLMALLIVTILVAGAGIVGSQLLTPSPTPPIPADRGSFRLVGPMAAAGRIYHTATLLPDGQVLIVGGGDIDDGGGPAREELWDPITEAFSDAGAMLEPRDEGATATLLPDGRVLIVGGFSNPDLRTLASAELWDPHTKTFAAAGTMAHGFRTHWAALQPDGRVLVWGTDDSSQDDVTPLLAAEMWDPMTTTFSPASPPLAPPRQGATLADGRILSVDGESVAIWDPATGLSSPGGRLTEDRGRTTGPTVTALPDGRVLVVGGHVCRPPDSAKTASLDTAGGCPYEEIDSAEIWDPATGLSNLTGAPMVARAEHTATLLPDGRVLVVGGRGEGNTSAELFEFR